MRYQDFHNKFYKEILPNKDFNLRNGQTLMIFLSEVWFAEYKRMTAKFAENVDCFYNDNLIPTTLSHLKNNWHNFFKDIKKVYYTVCDEANEDEFVYLTGERNIITYYVNNDEIVPLFDLNINIIDNSEQKIKDELINIGFEEENICLVKL